MMLMMTINSIAFNSMSLVRLVQKVAVMMITKALMMREAVSVERSIQERRQKNMEVKWLI